MSYAYQRTGAPLLSWKRNPPHQTRAADSTSLGDLILPRPGAPEPINSPYVAVGCSGCRPMGEASFSTSRAASVIQSLSTPVKVGGLLALAYVLHKQLKKR